MENEKFISEDEKYLLENSEWINPSQFKDPVDGEYIKDEMKIKIKDEEINLSFKHYKLRNPRGVVFLIHGLANCGDNMAPIANKLAEINFEVFTYDLIGK